jgi:hypothetical protein
MAVFWLILFVLLPGGGISLPAQTTKEYQIKAAFLLNFIQFVEWPSGVFTNDAEPFRIGILGENPFGAALEETVQGEAVNNRKIIIQHAQRISELKDCQMIFISKSEKGRMGEILAEVDSGPVLTVSEMEGFAQSGGVINFYLQDKKVRFEINPTAARRGGLKVSSQLLSLGKIVQPSKEGK